ncbi:MAG TPA: glycolate oxidase subunit GlcE [Lichenihabitans sp.]|nr:glycolate oxidase subunit GlcE [Lichenihabitans sp.]
MTILQPADAGEAADVIAWALAEKHPLEIVAGGSKRALGRPARTEHTLDVSRLKGIVDYEPAELVLTAKAATPIAEIETQLAARQQMLAFEPPDWRALLGGRGEPTLGGILACNLAGPRRARAGSARDFFLGFAAVNGRGEAWKAGGKVVKNVTGYDMCKLQAGAFGTLSLLTEATLKVMPKPQAACTVLLHGLADEVAIPTLLRALNTPHEVSGAAHLPASLARRSGVAPVAGGLGAVTALRIEGPAPSVTYRVGAVESLFGRGDRLDQAESERLWTEVASVAPLLGGQRHTWRLCPTPNRAGAVVQAIRDRLHSAEALYDWGGGLVWLNVDGEAGRDGGATIIRAAVARAGGHATLVAAPDAVRAEVPVFEPVDGALDALQARIKLGFDPGGILNPGRMWEGR